jgi:hypothetical protein
VRVTSSTAVAPGDGVAQHQHLEIRLRPIGRIPEAELVGRERARRGRAEPPEKVGIRLDESLEERVRRRLREEAEGELDRAEEQRDGDQQQGDADAQGVAACGG